MLDKGANPNQQDDKGNSVLHYVCDDVVNPLEKVQLLIDRGANPNVRNLKGKTPLDVAKAKSAKERGILEYKRTVDYFKSVIDSVMLFDLLDKADVHHKITKTTEKIGPDVMEASHSSSNSNKPETKKHRYFYDVRDVNSDGEIPRIFNAHLLEKMDKYNAKNPFSRADWHLDKEVEMKKVLKKAPAKPKKSSQPTQEGGKAHKTYKGRSYVVRTGSRGGKYILVNDEKIYL
jgi:NADH:ubiquinone oxidoreductase subunit